MELRNRTTGAIITDRQFRAEFSATSFPKQLTAEIFESFGYDVVFEGPQATVSGPYQYSQRDGVEEIDGKWFTKYITGPVFSDYTDEEGTLHTAAEQEAEYRTRKDEEQAKAIREQRNTLLADCDWTQLADAPVDAAAWADYRQALRDITSQESFPWEVIWPQEP